MPCRLVHVFFIIRIVIKLNSNLKKMFMVVLVCALVYFTCSGLLYINCFVYFTFYFIVVISTLKKLAIAFAVM